MQCIKRQGDRSKTQGVRRCQPLPAPPARPRLFLLLTSRLVLLFFLLVLVLGLGLGASAVVHSVLAVAAAHEPNISALHPRAMTDERAIRSNEEDLPPARAIACAGPARAAAERVPMQWKLATRASTAHAAEQPDAICLLQAADKGGVTAWEEGRPPRCAFAAFSHVLGEQVCRNRVDQRMRAVVEPPHRFESRCIEISEHAARGVKGEGVERHGGRCRIGREPRFVVLVLHPLGAAKKGKDTKP